MNGLTLFVGFIAFVAVMAVLSLVVAGIFALFSAPAVLVEGVAYGTFIGATFISLWEAMR